VKGGLRTGHHSALKAEIIANGFLKAVPDNLSYEQEKCCT
jgi:hypothetical protein